MKCLVIYDTNFGSTKMIAEIIAKKLNSKAIKVTDIKDSDFSGLDTIVVGSPIIGWRPSENMLAFLEKIKFKQLEGIKAFTFDTRVKLFIHGDAMKKIANYLKNKGARVIDSKAFYVKDKNGGLLEGELKLAEKWAQEIAIN